VRLGIDSIDSIDSIDIARRRTRLRPQDRVALHLTN
jgi:hypothetical protein